MTRTEWSKTVEAMVARLPGNILTAAELEFIRGVTPEEAGVSIRDEVPIVPGPGLWAVLRSAGFVRSDSSQASHVRVVEYSKYVGDRRRVTVQIWYDGTYRASSSFLGCSDTPPTEFETVEGMLEAISRESTRMDSRYALPGSTRAEQMLKLLDKTALYAPETSEAGG